MVAKNKYIKNAKISEGKFRLLIRYFVEDLSATQISNLLGISRNSVNRYILMLRKLIYTHSLIGVPYKQHNNQSIFMHNDYINNGNERSLYVGIFTSSNMVHMEIIPTEQIDTIKFYTNQDVVINDSGSSYDVVINFKAKNQIVINHATGENLDLIRGFLSFVKSRLAKFNGIDKKYFNLHLKECEFRFNNRGIDIYQLLLKLIRQNHL